MDVDSLTLVANPGSASRKYALFAGDALLAEAHFEYDAGGVVCTVAAGEASTKVIKTDLPDIADSTDRLMPLLHEQEVISNDAKIERIGVRVVAPSGFFLRDHVVDDEVLARLEQLRQRAPLHIEATLCELKKLREVLPMATVVGVSDSAFHATKPDHAWNYGLPLHDADRFEIKRFGYHGLSAESVVRVLKEGGKRPARLIICHLGGGASVTAVLDGKSRDTTMGYSPLEGVIMATRSGTIDATAVAALKQQLDLNDQALEDYLNRRSGLLGISGSSSDIRELLADEADGDHFARLALDTYIYSVQKAIGQMSAVLGGVDMLAFTGTVGERSAPIRERILKPFHYLDLTLDASANRACIAPAELTSITHLTHSRPVYVLPSGEAAEIARHVQAMQF